MTPKIFRLILILQWAFGILSVVVYYYSARFFPEALVLYLEDVQSIVPSTAETILFSAQMIILLVCIIDSIGLFFFQKWAKTLLIPVNVFAFILATLSPYFDIRIGLNTALDYLACVLAGGVIFSVYLPPISHLFERTDSQE